MHNHYRIIQIYEDIKYVFFFRLNKNTFHLLPNYSIIIILEMNQNFNIN